MRNWFVANDNGDVAGHDMVKEDAIILAENLAEEEPDAGWEAMSEDEDISESGFNAAVILMDDDIRERVHAELAPCTDQEFLDRYMELHEEKYGEVFTW